MKAIGPSFADELRAAGVPLDGIAWGEDGALTFRDDVAQAVRDQAAAVLAAHDPSKVPAPLNTAAAVSAMQSQRTLAQAQQLVDAGDTAGALRLLVQHLQENQ